MEFAEIATFTCIQLILNNGSLFFMIEKQEVEAKAAEFNITPPEVQKDYVYGWMLKGIFQHPILGRYFSLKGSGALRKGYFTNARYSKDLDFSVTEEIEKTVLQNALNEVCEFVGENTGVKFQLDRTLVEDKGIPMANRQILEARAYFDSFYGEKVMILKTQLDVTQFDKHYLPLQNRELIHPYSDAGSCIGTVVCQKVEEIFASKLVALLHRRRAKDLFDLFYGLVINRVPVLNRREVISTFLKRSIYEPVPMQGKQDLIEIPIEESRGFWPSLVVPSTILFGFEQVATGFRQLITDLFELISPSHSVAFPGTFSGYSRTHQIGRVRGYNSLNSLSRNTIATAGSSRNIVKIRYKGYPRLIEPYKFEYSIRKSDGQYVEYFWGYDLSGGESGKIGMKRFFADEIEHAEFTTQQFMPRWPVEL